MASKDGLGLRIVALATFVGSLQAVTFMFAFTVYRLYGSISDPWGLGCGAIFLFLALIPLQWTDGERMKGFIRWVCQLAGDYFPVTVIVEDAQAFQKGQSYVLALEPHSALPLGIPIVFATQSPLLPAPFRGAIHGMASSICFAVPLVRQLWWSLGLRPVSRQLLDSLLAQGKSVVLCPGGVQECLYMDHSSETLFLTRRMGFVKLAMRNGSPLVPVFVFGQSRSYSWWRPGPPGFIRWISRQMGAVPLMIWGRWGTSIPHKTPMRVVVGRPIPVPRMDAPSQEEVAKHLCQFIEATQALVERHKAAFGEPNLQLNII